MSGGGRPTRAAAHRASARVSALGGEDDDSDASKLEDGPAPMPPRKRARSGKGRPEVRRQSRVRAGSSQLSPAQKMQKMRQWFEHNEGIPPRGDTRPGFDMGAFWNHCCSGYNKALFAAALSKSSKMKKAHDARIARKKTTPAARKRRRNPTISSDESEGESGGAREEATWIDGVPVWSRCVPRMSA